MSMNHKTSSLYVRFFVARNHGSADSYIVDLTNSTDSEPYDRLETSDCEVV